MHDTPAKPWSRLSRRQFLAGTAAGALGASDLYRLVDRLTGGPTRSGWRLGAAA
jgi:hypothetical protein